MSMDRHEVRSDGTHLTDLSSASSLLLFALPLIPRWALACVTLLLAVEVDVDGSDGMSGVTLGASFLRICWTRSSATCLPIYAIHHHPPLSRP